MADYARTSHLSPAAFAVVQAAHQADYASRSGLAAAIRAAAYQVAPARPQLDSCCEHLEQAIRHKLLSIAAELGNFN